MSARSDWVAVMVRRDLIERIYAEMPDARIAPLSRVISALVEEALTTRRMLESLTYNQPQQEDRK